MISLIFPTYNEYENLPFLIEEVNKTISNIKERFELIFVDDCSTDETFSFLKSASIKDHRIKAIRFSRNFGSHAAITAGLNHAKGEAAIVLASDMQDPPEVILKLIKAWKKGAKIVWGVRSGRQGEKLRSKLFSRIYYMLINRLTVVKMPPQGADIFLIDKIVINAFNHVPEKHSSVFMVLSWLGFTQKSIVYFKRKRRSGLSKWSLFNKIKLVIDSILSFSDIPIRYGSVIGIFTASVGFIYAIYAIYRNLFGLQKLEGWSVVLIILLVISGIQMVILGTLGEYLWRTFDESRKRPRYIIESLLNLPG